jgi:hypothetical protein
LMRGCDGAWTWAHLAEAARWAGPGNRKYATFDS